MEMEAEYLRFQAAHPWQWHLFSLLSNHSPTHPPPNHVTWEQTEAEHLYSADLPGVRKEEIRVEVEDAMYLVIRTELNNEDDDDDADGGGRRRFTRKFRLPGMVDVDGISADYTHGVLTVTVPRMHTRARPRIIGAGPARDSAARAA